MIVGRETPFATRDILTENTYRIGGALPRTTKVGDVCPAWGVGEDCPKIPQAEWMEFPSCRSNEWNDIHQNGYPACCLAALCRALEEQLARFGRARTPLDWHKAWMKLSGGSGGVAIDAALKYAMSEGVPLKDGSGALVLLEAWDADSIESAASGLQKGATLVYGHDVHAECAVSLCKDDRGRWCGDTRNSWGKDWGEQGWHKFPLAEIEIQTYGAFLVREIAIRPIDIEGSEDAKP